MVTSRNPLAPRIRKARTGRWVGRRGPCGYEISADDWATNVADVLKHVDSTSHRQEVAWGATAKWRTRTEEGRCTT